MRKPDLESILEAERRPRWQRLLWLIALWSASVATLGLLAWAMRLLMGAAGLTVPH